MERQEKDIRKIETPTHTENREVRGGWGMGVATVLCMKLSKRKVLREIALSLLGKQKHKLKK